MGHLVEPIFIKEFLPKQILNLIYTYSIIKYGNQKQFKTDIQTNALISEHSDYLMETLMDLSTPVIEQNVKKKLFPTYSFFRIYDKGSDLKTHIDRESCEYTVALCLGAHPVDQPYEIFLGEKDDNSDYKYFSNKNNLERYRIDYKFPMLPNNAIIFKGMNKLHWREPCQHDHFITVFLHYVDQDGEYKDFKFDKRTGLGVKR
jgi:hypothetical protein|tara:strand:- start:1511 stop:2119 length:609 start_codon:yes stop_codon:yes gene_type:complete